MIVKLKILALAGALALACVLPAHAQSFIGTIASGQFYANDTASEAKPHGVGKSAIFDRAFGTTNGMLPYRTGGVWGTIQTGTSGATIPRNDTGNTFSSPQTVSSTTNPQIIAQNPSTDGACFQAIGTTHNVQLCEGATLGILKTVTNAELQVGTNNVTRWHYSTAGGLFADGVTGGDKGAGTLNLLAGGLYNAGTAPTGSGGGYVLANGPTITLANGTGLPISTGVSGLGTGVATALGVNVGTAGAPVVNGGALGTPSSGTGTNITGLSASNVTSGNLPDAQMPNTAWSAFTPSLTCGTATFTVNSARFKTWGKVTHIEIDFTITAIGTCTQPIQFTLPNTPQSGGAMSGQEVNVTAKMTNCFIQASSTTAGCRMFDASNWVVNYRPTLSGVYENQ